MMTLMSKMLERMLMSMMMMMEIGDGDVDDVDAGDVNVDWAPHCCLLQLL